MRVERYESAVRREWDCFVRASKNGTFLFERDYMEYHADRFVDHSLIVCDDNDIWHAILPANHKDGSLISHGGLTYGGFVTNERMSALTMLEVVRSTLAYGRRAGLRRLVYKAIPEMYHSGPAAEDLYALFRHGATLVRRDLSSAMIPSSAPKWQERRLRGAQRARKNRVTIERASDRLMEYWVVLEENLHSSHGLRPVHSLQEISRLQSSFPDHIKLHCAVAGDNVVGGVLMYETPRVAHVQYSASSTLGRSLGALDLLFQTLIEDEYRDKPYFDFGVSTEQHGRLLNDGLVAFKEGFGARSIIHDFYEVSFS